MYNTHGKVMQAKYCSFDQKPEHKYNQWTHCQKYFRATYNTDYKYTATMFQQAEKLPGVEKQVFSRVDM